MVPWRTIFFAINFGAAVFFFVICLASVGESFVGGGSPFAFLGGVCFAGPAAAFGIGEWLLRMRNIRGLEGPLGLVCGLVGAMALFAFASNAAEAAVKGGSPGIRFWLGFGAVCFAIAVYGLWCCWLRVRHRTLPGERASPNAGPEAP
jgi:hypothetical protein